MRLTLRPFVLSLSALLVSGSPALAGEASSEAGATIVQPIMIMAWEEMVFGTIAPSTLSADTVTLDAVGGRVCGTALTCVSGTYRPAKFSVTGASDALYTISLPTSITLSNAGGATLQVRDLTTPQLTRQLVDGYDEFMVGAVLDVGVNQATGSYIGSYVVSVDYS
ncbi:MAG: DUF4402 domain-containing protein [Henriciella sp.]|nr:DUF4402 domain-containing protein [Henriciella sp.]